MSQQGDAEQPRWLSTTRALLTDLRTLGQVTAPGDVAGGALARVGLADWFATVATPLGVIYIAWNQGGLSLAKLAASDAEFRAEAQAELARPVTVGTLPATLDRNLQAWLAGDAKATLTFDLRALTPFEQATLLKARDIPYGEVRPYGWIAREIGHPGAVRAVGTALARNPIPVFIPCHRVVRTDGHLGNYSLGSPQNKRVILTAEGVDITRLEELAAKGVRYLGNASNHSYCYPTCSGARETPPELAVPFHGVTEPQTLGYHPCSSCRPPVARQAS